MAKKKKKAKKVKTKELKVKAVKKTKPKPVKKDGKRRIALILSIIAIAVLAINAIYYIAAKDILLTRMEESLQELPAEKLGGADVEAVSSILLTVLYTLSVIWLVLAAAMVWTTCLLKRKKGRWYVLLILGILAFLTGRLGAGILAIVSSVLYKR